MRRCRRITTRRAATVASRWGVVTLEALAALAVMVVLLVFVGQWTSTLMQHRRSIERTPLHYHSLRLHRYELPAGALGAEPLRWVRTTYLDFADDPPWRAVRSYDGSSVSGKPGARRSTPTASSSSRTTIGDQADPP